MKTNSIKLYKSCDTLPIHNFIQILDKNDFRYLITVFDDENDTFELTKKQQLDYALIFNDIFYEYSDLTDNTKLRKGLREQLLIEQWSIIYMVITTCSGLYIKYEKEHLLKPINQIDYPVSIDFDKPILPQLESLDRKMKGLKNKIKIKKIKISKRAGAKDIKEEVKQDLERDALYLEKGLELGRKIDPRTTSVRRWIHLIEMNKERAKQYEATKNKHRRGRKGN